LCYSAPRKILRNGIAFPFPESAPLLKLSCPSSSILLRISCSSLCGLWPRLCFPLAFWAAQLQQIVHCMTSLPARTPVGRSAKWCRLPVGQCKGMPPAISPTSPNTSECLMRSRLLAIFASNLPSNSAGQKPSMPPVMYDPQSICPSTTPLSCNRVRHAWLAPHPVLSPMPATTRSLGLRRRAVT
jgi:hypothetical protein